ncbi:golgin subfamily A member 5-like isoform X2 [Styela clava]
MIEFDEALVEKLSFFLQLLQHASVLLKDLNNSDNVQPAGSGSTQIRLYTSCIFCVWTMSWIADLAGKAESLLNNIDQTAAGAINANDTLSALKPSPSPKPSRRKPESPISYRHSIAQIDYTEQSPISVPGEIKASRKPSFTKLESVKEKTKPSVNKKDTDAALFDFLNSNEKSSPRSTRSKTAKSGVQKSTSSTSLASSTGQIEQPKQQSKIDVTSQKAEEAQILQAPQLAAFHISRSSSIDSVNSKGAVNKSTNDNGSSSSEPNEAFSEAASESEFELVSNAAASSNPASERDSGEDASTDTADKSLITSLKMENRMLQNEIKALHQEMKSLSERSIRSKTETEKRASDLQRKYDDMMEKYHVKNSQMEAMNIEVNDLDNENRTLKQTIKNLQNERERIIDDQTAGSGMHAQALEQLRSRLEEAESALIRERDFNRTLKEDSLREREKQESESRKLAENLRKSERERQAEKKRMDDMSKEINHLQTSLASNKHELSDYKQKASRILQSKERLIASLKGGSEIDLSASTTTSIELEELKQERDSLKEDLMTARAELVQMRHEFQDMEGQYQQENSVLQEEVEELRRNVDEEMRAKREAEADVGRYEQDLRRSKEEATRARAAANERLQDKDEEIKKLRSQLMMKSRNAPDESELESRLRQLTETLIQKQTLVETLATEKSSMVLQLERAEGQIKRLSQENSTQIQAASNDGGESAGVHNRHTGGSTMFNFSNGTDHGVVGHVRKAASAVDRFSVRLGVFLRRYPIARLFVIVYMGLLHLWVMIVLLTYSPEIHGHDYQGHLSQDGKVIEHHAEHGLPNDG